MGKILTNEDLRDYLIAAAIFACGQVEDNPRSLAMIKDLSARALKVELVDPMVIPDDKLICTVSYQAGGGVPEDVKSQLLPYAEILNEADTDQAKKAINLKKVVNELSNFCNQEFYSYIAICTSPLQGMTAMYAAALDGKPCVDGDCCGRARPGYHISLTNATGISPVPVVMVTPLNETVILTTVADIARIGDICKIIHVVSGGIVTAVAGCPASIKEYRKGMVPNLTSRCIEIGKAVRKAREDGNDPIKAFIETSKARKIFEGEVESFEREARLGYTWGNMVVKGLNEFKGHTLRVWFKNENLVSWLDDKPYVTCPDLICIVDNDNCMGLGNMYELPSYRKKKVTVFGFPAHELWKTDKGLKLWNPKNYGFNIEYKPLE